MTLNVKDQKLLRSWGHNDEDSGQIERAIGKTIFTCEDRRVSSVHDLCWLTWSDLTYKEKEQARDSYVWLRAEEEEVPESEVDPAGVECCRFERQEDGYIYVDL